MKCLILFISAFLCINSSFAQNPEKFSEDGLSIWSLSAGYFPDYNDVYTSHGASFTLLSESVYNGKLATGWYFGVQAAFNKKDITDYSGSSVEGGMSLIYFANFSAKIGNNFLIFRAGIGAGILGYLIDKEMLAVEYSFPLNKNLSVSIGAIQEISRFSHLFPIQLNAGIRF